MFHLKKKAASPDVEYNIGDAAHYLNMRADQLRRYANEGRIACHRQEDRCTPYGIRAFRQKDLDAYNAGKVLRLVKALQRIQANTKGEAA